MEGHHVDATDELFGLMAEFPDADKLLEAARRVREAGFRDFDAYSPFPVDGMGEAIDQKRSVIPLLVFGAGVTGAITAVAMMWSSQAFFYPINSGGRPLASWPAWIPITFELTILFAALTAVVSMFFFNRLPMPYHPVFNVPAFQRASQDRFFLCIESKDPKFDLDETRRFLQGLAPVEVSDVAP
jgi:Alternative complex III, ActD subunit